MKKDEKLDRLLQSFTAEGVPGGACVVMKAGKPVYEGYFGYANLEKQQRITDRSLFRQASTTKLFTYVIGMMLYEEGRFLFTDPVYEYLPEWRHTCKLQKLPDGREEIVKLERPITIRDAFTMSCGLPYCMKPSAEQSEDPVRNAMNEALKPLCCQGRIPTLQEEVKAMAAVPVKFEPGTHWLYGFGSELVGAIIEKITGASLRRTMQERLIEPLELQDTRTFLNEEQRERLVTCYQVREDGCREPMPAWMDACLMEGGAPEYSRVNLNCSCRDFAVFMGMLANQGFYKGERLLGRHTIQLMRTNQLNEVQLADYWNNNGVDLVGYGYGLGVRTLMDRAAGCCNGPIGAFGWSGGYGSWAEASLEEQLAVVYMHNTQGLHNEYFHMKVRAAVYGTFLD